MKLLFDQGTPAPLRKHLPLHTVETAHEEGWQSVGNGELLAHAEAAGFDVLIITDQNLRYQQNLTGRKIGIVVLRTTSWPRIRQHLAAVVSVIDSLQSSSYVDRIATACTGKRLGGWYATGSGSDLSLSASAHLTSLTGRYRSLYRTGPSRTWICNPI